MVSSPPGARRGAAARLVAAHAALAAAIGLGAALLYSAVLIPAPRPAWMAIDLALLGGLAALVHRLRDTLGFAALGERRLAKIAALAALAAAVVLASQLALPDRNGVWLDESNYLETLRRGELLRHGTAPFNLRWLVPFLAGRWNVLPAEGAEALKAVNFAAFTVANVYLVLLLVRLRVPLSLAALAPLFLMSSYLGTYGAGNRLVVDAFNYAMFVLLLHALVRPEHGALFGALLLLASFNSEKAIAWLPLLAAVTLLRRPRPWSGADLLASLRASLRAGWPALLYLAALMLYMAPAKTELLPCTDNLHLLSFTALRAPLGDSCAQGTTFQMLWFPFGPFTVYALLALPRAPRWLRALPLLLVPVFLQVLAATDTERMTAYAFIVFLPLGFLYLTRALAALPRWLGRALLAGLVTVAVAQHYLIPVVRHLHLAFPTSLARMTMSGLEVALVGALILLHHAVYGDEASAGGGAAPGAGGSAAAPHARS